MRCARYLVVGTLIALFSLSAQEIKIASGVSDEQVLQRNPHQGADLHLTGTVTAKKANGKPIEVRITSTNNVLSNFDWAPSGRVQKQNWTADLIGIPYRVTVSKRSLKEKSVELKGRVSTEAALVSQDVAADRILDIVRQAREAAAR